MEWQGTVGGMSMVGTRKLPVATIFVFLLASLGLAMGLAAQEVNPLLVILVGIVGTLGSPPLAILLHRLFIAGRGSGPLHIPVAVGLAVAISIAASLYFSGAGQVFASFGAVKKVAVPATFAVLLLALIFPARTSPVKPPIWWSSLCVIVMASLALQVYAPRQPLQLMPVIQGVALMGSVLLVSLVAFKFPRLSDQAKSWLLVILVGAALVSSATGLPLGLFVALQVPSATLLVVMALRGRQYRVLALLGAVVIGATVWHKAGTENASSALLTQVAVGLGIVFLTLLPRRPRMVAAVLGVVGGVVYLFANGTILLMAGQAGTETDVTLVHRAYEAQQAYGAIGENPISLIFGLGPGATVNLVSSPDFATLAASGRDLSAVDDVHFLMVWVILKFGILGAAWLTTVLIAIARVAWKTLNHDVLPVFDIGMLLFLLTGLIAALPAATHLFANPLPFLCLAILQSRELLTRQPADVLDAQQEPLALPVA